MARYVTTLPGSAPAADTFSFLADFETIERWDPGVKAARRLRGEPAAVGTVYRLDFGFFGRTLELDYEVLESQPPTATAAGRIVLEAVTGDFTSYDVITVRPVGDGCEVTYDADLRLHGWRRPFDLGLQVVFGHVGDKARDGLADILQRVPTP